LVQRSLYATGGEREARGEAQTMGLPHDTRDPSDTTPLQVAPDDVIFTKSNERKSFLSVAFCGVCFISSSFCQRQPTHAMPSQVPLGTRQTSKIRDSSKNAQALALLQKPSSRARKYLRLKPGSSQSKCECVLKKKKRRRVEKQMCVEMLTDARRVSLPSLVVLPKSSPPSVTKPSITPVGNEPPVTLSLLSPLLLSG
jgi:hypothetical protein